jgi:hypothetical protein
MGFMGLAVHLSSGHPWTRRRAWPGPRPPRARSS